MIDAIISGINSKLVNECLKQDLNGLAELIVRRDENSNEESNDTFIPAIIDNQGECKYVFVDDDFDWGLYHRLITKTYDTKPNKGFGDKVDTICTVELNLICWGLKSKVTEDEAETFILKNIPEDYRVISIDYDKKRVFAGEIQGVAYFIPPEYFLFALKYKVQYRVDKACLEINEKFICNT